MTVTTWTNIGAKLSSCAGDLDTVCSSRLAGQESLAVATFKTLQAGSSSHLRMTGQLAGVISGGLTVASMIVRMVHDMVRDAIADIIGKLASKVAIGVLTAGLAAPWAVSSAIADVTSWATRLSKEVTDVATSAKNLKKLLDKAETLFRRVGKKWESLKASRAEKKAAKKKAAENPADDAKNADDAADATKGTAAASAVPPKKSGGGTPPSDKGKTPHSPDKGRDGAAKPAPKKNGDPSQTYRAYGDALPTTFSTSFLKTGLLTPHEKSLMGLGLGIPTATASKLFTNQESPGPKIHYTQVHTSERQRAEKHIEFHWKEIQRYDRPHHCRSAVHGN